MDAFASAIEQRFKPLPERCGGLPISVKPPRHVEGRAALAAVMNDLGFTRGIEIGTRTGDSAELWCRAMPGLKLTCIDPYAVYGEVTRQHRLDSWYAQAQARLVNYDAELWRMTGRDAAARFEDESVDFVYIDGDHRFDAVVVDLVDYVPKVRTGGMVVLHDYFRHFRGSVVDAVDAYTRCHGIDPWYVTFELCPTAFWQRGAEVY